MVGPQPRLADQRDDVVGVVVGEQPRRAHRELVQGAPHPVVGAGLREVVTGDGAAGLLRGDHGVERVGGPVHDRGVRKGPLEDHDPGTVGERPDQLGLHVAAPGRGGGVLAEAGSVDQDPLLHGVGIRVVGRVDILLDDRPEVLEAAVALGEPASAGASGARSGHELCSLVAGDVGLIASV